MIDKQTRNTYRNMAILPRGAVSSLVDAIDELEDLLGNKSVAVEYIKEVDGYWHRCGACHNATIRDGDFKFNHCPDCGRKLIW